MVWFAAGLFILGAVCGAAIRLMVFLVVLFGAAVIAIAATWSQGFGMTVLHVVVAVVSLQVGYAAGLILRTRIQTLHKRAAITPVRDEPVGRSLGEKNP
jgi:hypothetical protein